MGREHANTLELCLVQGNKPLVHQARRRSNDWPSDYIRFVNHDICTVLQPVMAFESRCHHTGYQGSGTDNTQPGMGQWLL